MLARCVKCLIEKAPAALKMVDLKRKLPLAYAKENRRTEAEALIHNGPLIKQTVLFLLLLLLLLLLLFLFFFHFLFSGYEFFIYFHFSDDSLSGVCEEDPSAFSQRRERHCDGIVEEKGCGHSCSKRERYRK
jgi:hypothetical protein